MNILKGLQGRIEKKRQGLYVSRPVLNGEAWANWAAKHGVPNPVPADKMHVTVIASRTGVVCKPQTHVHQTYSTSGQIAFLGLDESVMVFLWADWPLCDRHHHLLGLGCVSDWPEFRPHVTLSYDAKGFELSDEAIAQMPPSFIFGPEIHGPFDPSPSLKKAAGDGEAVAPDAPLVAMAKEALPEALAKGEIDAFDRHTLTALAEGLPVLKSAYERLAQAVSLVKVGDLGVAAGFQGQGSLGDVGATPATVLKSADEDRMVYGFASVSLTKDGHVEDSHKDLILTKALRSLCHGLMKGQRAGKINHVGAKKTEIVEGLVFTPDLWKALGDYLHKVGEIDEAGAAVFKSIKLEGLFTGFHVEDDALWKWAQEHDFELSIGAEEASVMELTDG